MTYVETCSCGASMTIRGWGIRDVGQAVTAFRQEHAACRPRVNIVNVLSPGDP